MIRFEPPNPQAQQEQALAVNPANQRRRRALAEALAASAPKTVQNTGQGLAMMGMQAAGGFLDGMTERREQAAEQQRRVALADGLIGSFGDQLPGNMNRDQFRNFAIANPEGAAKMGFEMLQSRLRPQERFETITLPDGRQAQRSSLTGKIEPMSEGRGPIAVAPGASVIDPRTNQPVFTAPNRPDTISPEAEAQKKRLAEAGAARNNVSVNTAANPIVDGFGKQFVEQRESAIAAANTIRSIHEARKQIDSPAGIMTGFGAGRRLDVARVGALFGITDPKVIANTESFRAAIGSTVLAQAKALGANPTNTDRDYIEKVQAGQIELNEDTIRRMLDINERTSRDAIRRYNLTADQVLKELEANPNVDRTALSITRTLGRVSEPDEYRRPDPPPPQGTPTAPVPTQGPPQGQPVQQGPQQPQQAPPPPITLDALDAEIMRKQQILEQQQRAQQSQMGVAP